MGRDSPIELERCAQFDHLIMEYQIVVKYQQEKI